MIDGHILAFDPSGAFHEGKGTTGWCLMYRGELLEYGLIEAKDFKKNVTYYSEHLKLIRKYLNKYPELTVVVEDYLLYATRAHGQINSHMETCKLIGILQYYCYEYKVPCVLQTASQVKKRWSDEILKHEGIDIPDTYKERHARDAIRHAMHFTYFGRLP